MIDLNAIARHYGGEVTGGQARIPAIGHSKRDRGVAIKADAGAPDGVLIHCFNGGDPLEEKDRLREDGFLPEFGGNAEFNPQSKEPPRTASRNRTVQGFWFTSDGVDLREQFKSHYTQPEDDNEALPFTPATAWDYYDADGVMLYRKKRVDMDGGKKKFLFERPDGKAGKGDAPHVLYRLPELLTSSGDVFLAEGEKCADKLVHMGFEATSLKDLDKCDLEALRGRRCIILPDNDAPGEKEADKALEALQGIANEVLTIRLPDLPDKGDIEDWTGTSAQLLELVEKAEAHNSPVDLWADYSVPPLPTGLMPSIIERFAFENAKLVGADPAGFAMSALAVCGAALPDRIAAKPKVHEDWSQPARLWVLLIGDASTNKSTCISKAASRMRGLEYGQMIENNRKLAEWQENKRDGATDPKPLEPRLVIEDTTPEAAQEALKDSPNGILALHDEMSGMFAKCGQANNQAERAFWLQTYNGGNYSISRIGRGKYIIENLSVSMLGGIQPEAMHSVVNSGDDDGLIQRFIPILLDEADIERDVPTAPVNEELAKLVDTLREFPGPDGFLTPSNAPYEFSQEAREIRVEFLHVLRDLAKNIKSVNTRLSSHVGKYRGIFVRLCILWHAIEQAENVQSKKPVAQAISGDTASRVRRFMTEYLFSHALAFYRSTGALTDDDQVVQSIGGWILSNGIETFTERDLVRNVRQFKALKDDIKKARITGMLEAYGWAECDPKKQHRKVWFVPQEVHKMYAQKAVDERDRRQAVKKIIADAATDRRKVVN